jgi:hypothetical protein
MPVNNRLEGSAQRVNVEWRVDSERNMNVVGRARTIELMHEPQGPLAIREWILNHLLPSLY